MRLHVLGVPHTRTDIVFSHCAFTQKVLKFLPMMSAQGYEVVHYGVGEKPPAGAEHVPVLSERRQELLLGRVPGADPRAFIGDGAAVDNPVYKAFNAALAPLLKARVAPEDIVCHTFGQACAVGGRSHAGLNLETGIGYPDAPVTPYRIFESQAWMHWHAGRHGLPGSSYHWVIPNFFDVAEWITEPAPRGYLAFLGRIAEAKGLNTIAAIAEARPDLEIRLAGQGNPEPWLARSPNIKYVGPLVGRERAAYLAGALALLAPTGYIEPFCGVTVEANLCGTPAITTPWGAFTETVQNGVNGFRCHTLGDFLEAIRRVERHELHHDEIAATAAARYGLSAIGPQYNRVLQQIADLRQDGALGWYNPRSHHVP